MCSSFNLLFVSSGTVEVKAPPKIVDTGGGFFLEEEEKDKIQKTVDPSGKFSCLCRK